MSSHASSENGKSCSIRKVFTQLQRFDEIMYRMYHDFPVLDHVECKTELEVFPFNRVQCEVRLVVFPFNLPSRNFMQSLDEDLFELSHELQIILAPSSHAERGVLRDHLGRHLEAIQSAFEVIYDQVSKLDPVRLGETLAELGEEEDAFDTTLYSLVFNED